MRVIKVVVVDDNRELRNALAEILDADTEIRCLATFATAGEALKDIPLLTPDVVLMDINLGSVENGIDCVRQLKPLMPNTAFMMCTVYEEDEKIFEALTAGATGYILKKTMPSRMIEAIKQAFEGGAPMSSQIARKVVAKFLHKEEQPAVTLSKKEKKVLALFSEGLDSKEVASELAVGEKTVKRHSYNIYQKLHVIKQVIPLKYWNQQEEVEDSPEVIPDSLPEFEFSPEQLSKFFELSLLILPYINHDLAGHQSFLSHRLDGLKDEINKSDGEVDVVKARNLLNSAVNHVQSIRSVIEVLKNYFGTKVNGEPFDVNKKLFSHPYSIVQELQERHPGTRFDIGNSPTSLEIAYPAIILSYILSELTVNAKKNGGPDVDITILWSVDANQFTCEFHDNGPGFPGVSDTAKVIRQTVVNSRDNPGMGLKLIEWTVMRSGGSLSFSRSGMKDGALIVFKFPVVYAGNKK